MQNIHHFRRLCTCQLESIRSVYFLWPCCGAAQGSLCLSGGGLMVHHSSAPHHVFFFFTSTFIACLFWLVLYHCAVEFRVRNGRLSIHPLYFHRTEAIAEWMTSLFCNDPHHPSVISQDNGCMVSLLYDICVKLHMWDISPAWMKMVWLDKVKNNIIWYYYNIVWVLWFYGYFNIYLDTVKEVFYVHKNNFETILMKSV